MIQSRYTWATLAASILVIAITLTEVTGGIAGITVGVLGAGFLVALRPTDAETSNTLADWDTDQTRRTATTPNDGGGSQ